MPNPASKKPAKRPVEQNNGRNCGEYWMPPIIEIQLGAAPDQSISSKSRREPPPPSEMVE
jgi:hypothetical protein